jgi:hypothetical protein
MAGLENTVINAAKFKPTEVDNSAMGKKWLLKELMHTEYLCKEHKHVSLKFLPSGVLHVFGEQKQPVLHSYSISHSPTGDWIMTTSPSLLDKGKTMTMKLMKNHVTLYSNESDEVLHLNKLNLKAYDSSK